MAGGTLKFWPTLVLALSCAGTDRCMAQQPATRAPGATQAPPGAVTAPSAPGPSPSGGRPTAPAQPWSPDALPSDAARTPLSPLDTGVKLKPAPMTPNDLRFPINLAAALKLSDARPLIVAAAQARVWVAEAELTQAKVLWIPTLNIGFDYIRHDGGGPDFNKGILTTPSTNFFYAGAGLTGAPSGSFPQPMRFTSRSRPGKF